MPGPLGTALPGMSFADVMNSFADVVTCLGTRRWTVLLMALLLATSACFAESKQQLE